MQRGVIDEFIDVLLMSNKISPSSKRLLFIFFIVLCVFHKLKLFLFCVAYLLIFMVCCLCWYFVTLVS